MTNAPLDPPPPPAPEAPLPATPQRSGRQGLYRLVDQLIASIATASKADFALLKRINLEVRASTLFYRLWVTYIDPKNERHERDQRRWAWLLREMAKTHHLHRPHANPGQAFQRVLSEARLNRLLEADENTIEGQLGSALRMLDQRAISFDWALLVDLYLSTGTTRRDQVRRWIARAYFYAERDLSAPAAGAPSAPEADDPVAAAEAAVTALDEPDPPALSTP